MIRSIFLAIALASFSTSAVFAADVIESVETAASKCIQSVLNDLGHNAGAVDGFPGQGTNAAVQRYLASNPDDKIIFDWYYPIRKKNASAWCLYVGEKKSDLLSPQTIALHKKVYEEAETWIPIKMNGGKPTFSVTLEDEAGNRYFEASSEEILNEEKGVWVVAAPYSEVDGVDRISVSFTNGWSVLDSSGNRYPRSANTIHPAFFVPILYQDKYTPVWEYNVAK